VALLERANQALNSLDEISEAKSEQAEASELGKHLKEFEDVALKAVGESHGRSELIEFGVPLPKVSLGQTLRRVDEVIDRFEQDPSPATLRKGRKWQQCLDDLSELAINCEHSRRQGWGEFLSELFTGESPEKIKARLAMTPENKIAVAKYEVAFGKKVALQREKQITSESVVRAQAIALELQEAFKEINFGVPVAVKKFIDAVASYDGAPLSLLTPEVFDWLRDENILESYSVRHRR
jgi:hypothetical protein